MAVGEDYEEFEVMREDGRHRRSRNTLSSTGILEREKIPFVSHNNGIHLVVADRWDFWPATGLYMDRKNQGKRRRGVFNLLKEVRREKGNVPPRD